MRNLKRALSMLLTSTMVLGMMVMGSNAAGYKDVDASKNNVEAIEVLQAVSIMSGDENGNFNPEKGVTRNEMAVIMSKLMAYNVATYAGTSPFTDVPSWAEPYVAACYTNGITAGISDTLYGGDQTVTTAQAALMIMKALGYFQYSTDFGSDWQLATVSQGNKIDLFEKVNSGVKEAMTRNDVAQLVLNGLESGIVEATTNGSITVGDTTIVSGVKYNYVTSTQDYAKSIDTVKSTNETTDANAFIVELGEKLYMGSLRKDETVNTGGALTFYEDVFGRPATRWEYQSKEIGVYADEADHAFSSSITAKDLYNAVGRTAAENYIWTITIDGDEVYQDEGFKALVDNKTDSVKEVIELTLGLANGTGNGVRTEVFVDAVNGYVHMSLTHYYAAEVYTVDKDNGITTLADLGNGPAALDDEFETTGFEDDQVVVYSYTKGEIQEVYAATSMEGTVTATRVKTDEKDGDYYIVDGTKYKYNWSVPSEDRLETENVNNDMVGYLDQYGYAIYIDEAAVSYDYAYVLSMGNDGDIYGGNADTWYARLVLTDGTVVKAETDEDDATLENHIVSYTVDKNGVYTLSDRSNGTATANIDNIDVDNGIASFEINGKNYTANSSTVFIIGDSAKDPLDYNNYDFTSYTGVKNMPNITNGTNDKFVIATADNSNVAKVVYVQDADVSGAGDVYFVRANVGAKLVNDSELGRYREIDAVVNGEVVTLKVKEGTTAEEILCGGVSNQVSTLTQLTPSQGLYLNDAGTQRILALESITTNADGLVTNVRLYDARNAQGDGFVNFYTEGTDKATKETVMLGGTEDGTPGTRYAWYDDVVVVRWDAYAGAFKVSTINSVKADVNDRAVAVLADDVLNGLCIVEYKTGATLPIIPEQDVTVDMEDANFTATFDGLAEGETIADAQVGDPVQVVIKSAVRMLRASGDPVTSLEAGVQYSVKINNVDYGPYTVNENGELAFTYKLTEDDIAAGKVIINGVFTYVEEPVEPGEGEVTLTVNAPNAAVTINGEAVTSAAVKENTDATITVTANTGYELVAVKVGDETITANADGSYTIKVADADVTVTVETKETTPAPSGDKAPGTYEVDTETDPKVPEITIYYHADDKLTEAEAIAIVAKAGYSIDAIKSFSDTTGGDGIKVGSADKVCTITLTEVVALSVDGTAIKYAEKSGATETVDLKSYIKTGATLTADMSTSAVNTYGKYSWNPTADTKLVNAYAFEGGSNITKIVTWDTEKNEWGTSDVSSNNFIPCDAQLKITGAASTNGKYAQLTVDGKSYGEAKLGDASGATYELKNGLADLLNEDNKIVLDEVAGYKLVVDGVALDNVYDADGSSKIVISESKVTGLDLTTYLAVKDGDSLTGAKATDVYTLSKNLDSTNNWEYSFDKVAATNAVDGVITLVPAVQVTFAKSTSYAKFDDFSNIMNDALEMEDADDESYVDEIYVAVGTKITLTTVAGDNFDGATLDNATYGIAYKPMKADGSAVDADAKYTVTTGKDLTVDGSSTTTTLSATFTIEKAVQFDVVSTADSGSTWTTVEATK